MPPGLRFFSEESPVTHRRRRFLFLFLWFRATFPRYRYDQIMRLGWKVLLPVTIVWLAVEGVMVYFKVGPWFG